MTGCCKLLRDIEPYQRKPGAIPPDGVGQPENAQGRTRTGTELPPRDFKSLVSTNSTTRARLWSKRTSDSFRVSVIGGWGRNRTGVDGFAGRCITTLPPSQGLYTKLKEPLIKAELPKIKTPRSARGYPCSGYVFGAGNETRTRDIHVGNVTLYQLSYSRNSHLS